MCFENTIQALMQLAPEKVMVMRNSKQIVLNTSKLVPRDYVLLQAGDKLPQTVDRNGANSTVNESILSRESFSVEKKADTIDDDSPTRFSPYTL